MTASEEWRAIPGFPGYEISSHGRVVSHKRRAPREMRTQPDRDGYQMVSLVAPQGHLTRAVHSLVMLAFVGERPPGLEVRHLNGDPTDNRVHNLAYGTHAQNMRDRLLHGNDRNATKTSCRRGHPYDEINTYRPKPNHRQCRQCVRANSRAYRIRCQLRAARTAA